MQDNQSNQPLSVQIPEPDIQVSHLDTAQLAHRLNISVKSLARMRQNGCGPRFMRIGAKILYRLTDVYEYEQSRLYNAVGSPVMEQGGTS